MKKKYINGLHWKWTDKYNSNIIHIENNLCGYVSLVKIEKVKYKITVDYDNSEMCLFDDGYKCLIFLPDNENYCVSCIFDRDNKVVEWYFDITKENSIDSNNIPFFYDIYLDIAISPDFQITILDEDELQDALDRNTITKSDYELAHSTCEHILDKYIPDKFFMIDFFQKYLKILS